MKTGYPIIDEMLDKPGPKQLFLELFGSTETPEKKKTYASSRTRSPRWRAGSKSCRPKHNWSKKRRQWHLQTTR